MSRTIDVRGSSLQEALARQGQLVLITGEPGIGKTRLAEEALPACMAERLDLEP
jgi:transcriptional regulator with AAA-type ATPase domain